MKKLLALTLALILCTFSFATLTACNDSDADFTVGICQLMEHESLDKATNGFVAALTEELEKAGIYKEANKDVIRPSQEECVRNPRAKCTKMRWAVRSEE